MRTPSPTLLSVVMPVFNGERFLDRAVASILDQSFRAFDFHIVDDGSTDRTPRILEQYAARDARVRVHTLPRNAGIVAARNLGCAVSSGELIAVMDADDVSLPHRFERQVEFLARHPDIGVLGSQVQVIDEHDRPGQVWPCPPQPGVAAWSMLFYCCLAHSSVIMRRAVAERIGVYPVGFDGAEDYALFMRLLGQTRMANVDEVLVQYRVWSSSYSQKRWDRLEALSARLLIEVTEGLPGAPVSDDDVRLLRDFARHRYPMDLLQLTRLGKLVAALRGVQVRLHALRPEDVHAFNVDAGIRLWMLAALALRRRSLGRAMWLAREAVRSSGSSFLPFAGKLLRRVA